MGSWARLPVRTGGGAAVLLTCAAIAWCGCGSASRERAFLPDASRDDGGTQGGGDDEGGASALDAGAVTENDFCNEVAAGLARNFCRAAIHSTPVRSRA